MPGFETAVTRGTGESLSPLQAPFFILVEEKDDPGNLPV
jgi:hypothetical protein